MLLTQNEKTSNFLFFLATFLIVLWIYNRVDDPLQFFLCGGGVMVSSFFLRRGIKQLTGS